MNPLDPNEFLGEQGHMDQAVLAMRQSQRVAAVCEHKNIQKRTVT